MKNDAEIMGVKIGDKFKPAKHLISVVVDFYEVTSLTTGKHICFKCIARVSNGLSTNEYEVPFATVVRNKVTDEINT